MAMQRDAGQGIHLDLRRLTLPHQAKLRFLEVRFQIKLLHGHDGHQAQARLHELADARGQIAHPPGDTRPYHHVADVALRRLKLGARALALRLRLGDLRLQTGDATLSALRGRPLCRDVLRRLRRLGAQRRQLFPRLGTSGGERGIARHLGRGEARLGLRRCQHGPRLLDRGFLFADQRFGIGGIGGGEIDLRLTLRGLGGIVGSLDAQQWLAGLHILILMHQHFADIAGHAGGYGDAVGLQIGVFGALLIFAICLVPHEPERPRDQRDHGGRAQDQAQPAPLGSACTILDIFVGKGLYLGPVGQRPLCFGHIIPTVSA